MIKLPWPFTWDRRKRKPVQFNVINAVELKPEANYIIFADESSGLNRAEVQKLLHDLRKAGVRNVVSFLLSGNPDEAVQIISKEKNRATTRHRNKHS